MANINGTLGNDTLTGTKFNDVIVGLAGNDTLYGSDGNDKLIGDYFSDSGESSQRYKFSGKNVLYGDAGNDVLYSSRVGLDTLYGGSGNDTLYATTFSISRDSLNGGSGDDTYILSDAASTIIEAANTGIDTVQTYNSYELGSNLENLTLTQARYGFILAPVYGTGNSLNNTIIGNDTNNILLGKAGNDLLDGNAGNDIIDGSNGFVLSGIDGNDLSLSPSDINGDGFDDIIIGAFNADPNGKLGAGSSYVVFGKDGGFDANFNLSTLNGKNGFVVNGINPTDFSSASVSSAGDINGDGFDDLLIGARLADPNAQTNAGASYVVFGKARGFNANLNLSDLDGSNGFAIYGFHAYDNSGTSVSNAGDVNGDGFDDIIIGANYADANGKINSGASYVVFGTGSFSSSLNLSEINGKNGFIINGVKPNDYLGTLVSNAGDINGDGFDDLTFGSGYSLTESYVILGRDFTSKVTHAGTSGNDRLLSTDGNDILIGGLGNDILKGEKGSDVVYGGAGNDIIDFGAIDKRTNGGNGTDTLRIDGSGVTLDLTAIPNNKITGFEIIDITGKGNNSLKFTRLELLDLSDSTNRPIVNGNVGDKLMSTQQGWQQSGTTTLNGILYNQFTAGAATLLVDTDITATIT